VTNDSWTYLAGGLAIGLSLIAWAALVLVPAWTSYSKLWERAAATVLSLYVLAGFLLAGIGLGAAILYYYDEL
jgi:hypothetical protein